MLGIWWVLFACGGPPETSEPGPEEVPPSVPSAPAAPPGGPAATAPPGTWDVVGEDGARRGTVRFEGGPPWKAEAVDGDVGGLVERMNALDHVLASSLSGERPRIARTEDQFFRILRYGWLAEEAHVVLRVPRSGAGTTSWTAYLARGDAWTPLASVSLDDRHYATIVEGKGDVSVLQRAVASLNGRDAGSMDIAPPPGERGSWGRGVPRGSIEHLDLLRADLAGQDLVLVASDVGIGEPVQWLTLSTASAPRLGWIGVPASLSGSTPGSPIVRSFSGPPGGPLGVVVRTYEGAAPTDAGIAAQVAAHYGSDDTYAPGVPVDVAVGGRTLRGLTFRTGRENARADHLLVAWPTLERQTGETPSDEGVSIEVYASGRGDAVDLPALLATPAARIALATLTVHPDPY